MVWIILGCLLFLFLLWFFLTCPSPKKKAAKAFTAYRYAHRGLWGEGVAENSLTAFKKAADAGFAMELDVQLSLDDKLVVFHDDSLKRVTGVDKNVNELTYAELSALSLSGTKEGVPLFSDVLAAVGGRVPILVEIKEESTGKSRVAPALLDVLKTYDGPIVIESFNPLSLNAVKKLAPSYPRGLLCSHFTKEKKQRSFSRRLMQHFLLNFLCRPQFIAYNVDDRTYFPFRWFRFFYRPVTYAWTVRSAEAEKAAYESGFGAVIFERYLPEDTQ